MGLSVVLPEIHPLVQAGHLRGAVQAHVDGLGTVNRITENLTNRALRRMNGAVDLDGRKPAEVAKEFLLEEGLI